MPEEVFLNVSSNSRYLCLVRDVTKRITGCMGFSEEESARTVLALDEACCNVIKYSYGENSSGKVEITFKILEKALEITIRDYGQYGKDFDIDTLQCIEAKKVEPGGYGVGIMKCVMDRIEYTPCSDGRNTLTMLKRIK
ncbi:MAG: ATP-binding protein [Deltaproteobacteria bacterium]|nr:ATP-binding protein [Deltaproteobacteria bacterium]